MSLNDEQNAAWDALYARASKRPAAETTPPPAGMNARETTAWLYSRAGRSLQIVPPDPPANPLARIYDKPLRASLSSQRPA